MKTSELRKQIAKINKEMPLAHHYDAKRADELSRQLREIKKQISANAEQMMANLKVGTPIVHPSFVNEIFNVEKIMKKNIHIKSLTSGKRYKVSAADIDLVEEAQDLEDLFNLGF
jgi:hypothetical protein